MSVVGLFAIGFPSLARHPEERSDEAPALRKRKRRRDRFPSRLLNCLEGKRSFVASLLRMTLGRLNDYEALPLLQSPHFFAARAGAQWTPQQSGTTAEFRGLVAR